MERREFLKLGGLSTLGMAAPTVAAASPDPFDEGAVEVACLNMDAGIASIRARLGKKIDAERALGNNPELREAMRTLIGGYYAYQAFTELPIEVQTHPELQVRIEQASDDIDTGIDALKAALTSTTDAEMEALERIWQGGHEQAVGDVERSYAKHGGTLKGRRRLQRISDMAARDIRRKGLRGTFTEYISDIDAIRRSPPPQQPLDPEQAARAKAATKAWRARGAKRPDSREKRAYDPVPVKDPGAAKAGGVLLVVVGAISCAFGAALVWCPCIGVPFIALGVILIIFGAKFIRRADATYREEEEAAGEKKDSDGTGALEGG